MAVAHESIAEAYLHEPKGMSVLTGGASDSNKVYVADGTGTGAWSALPNLGSVEHFSIQNADLGKGSTAPTENIVGNYTVWAFSINDDAVITLELPHNIDTDEDIGIHLSWACNEAYATNTGEVQWQAAWSLTPHDSTESLAGPTHSGTAVSGDVNIPATAHTLTHTTLTIAAANVAEEDTLGFTVKRIALDAGTNPTAEPVVLAMHLEYTTKGV